MVLSLSVFGCPAHMWDLGSPSQRWNLCPLQWECRVLTTQLPRKWFSWPANQHCLHAKLLQSCLTLCDPMDYSPPGSFVHGILQARIQEWLPCPPPGHLPYPGTEPASLLSPALAGGFFTTSTTWEAHALYSYFIYSSKVGKNVYLPHFRNEVTEALSYTYRSRKEQE